MQIVDPHPVYRDVGGVVIEMRGLDLADFAPRCQRGGRDVRPMFAGVVADPDQAVVRARPEEVAVVRRHTQRVDDTALMLQSRGVQGSNTGWQAGVLACQVRTEGLPVDAAVVRPIELVGRVVEGVGIGW